MKIDTYTNSLGIEMVSIDNGDSVTCMTKEQWDTLNVDSEGIN